jgi:hypothetical protein
MAKARFAPSLKSLLAGPYLKLESLPSPGSP